MFNSIQPHQVFNEWLSTHVSKDDFFKQHEIHGYDLHAGYPESIGKPSTEQIEQLEAYHKLCTDEIAKLNPDPKHIIITFSGTISSAGGPWPNAFFSIDVRVIDAEDHTSTMKKLNLLMAEVIQNTSANWSQSPKLGFFVHAEVKGKTIDAELEMRHHFTPHICHLAGEKFELRNPWKGDQGVIALQKAMRELQEKNPEMTTEDIYQELVFKQQWKRPIEGVPYAMRTIEKYKIKPENIK